ncbi:MAG: chemotaxis protein CheX [Agarilytica sp.]
MQTSTAEAAQCLDTKFITPFLHGVKQVCKDMVGIEPLAQSPKPYTKPLPIGDAASVMPMNSPILSGQLCISFTEDALLDVSQRLLGEVLNGIDEVALDVAGEITNMVTGVAKARLQEAGYDFDLQRPASYSSESFSDLKLVGSPRIVVPYELPKGKLFVDLGFIPS